jgi:hypothetical protein
LKQPLDGEASSPCNYFAARIFLKIRAERAGNRVFVVAVESQAT